MPLNLYSQDSTEGDSDSSVPSYMIAANNHNTGNLNPSLFDEEQGNAIERAGKFIAVSAFSGVNSFYNTAVWAGNLFSDKDAQYRDTRDWINTFDENLGDYYQNNRQAADLVGFVATSFVPGLGGVKVFNAGVKALTAAKEGSVAINMAKGLGVLPGQRDMLVKAAVASYDTTRTAFSISNPATLKAVAAGFGEQALQSAAFEVAVTATMKKSPILNDLDVSDTISNIATGALLGGAIGGVIEGAITLSRVKQGIKAMDTKLAGVTQDVAAVAGTKPSDSLLIIRNDLDTLPRNPPEGVDPVLYDKLWEDKIGRLDNKSREHFTTLTGGDSELGGVLYEGLRTDPTGAYSGKLLGLEEIGTTTQAAQLIKKYGIKELPQVPKLDEKFVLTDGGLDPEARAYKMTTVEAVRDAQNLVGADTFQKLANVRTGKLSAESKAAWEGAEAAQVEMTARRIVEFYDKVAPGTRLAGDISGPGSHAIRHFKLWGDDMGKLSDDAPAALHLADMSKKPVEVKANRVIAGDYTHDIKIGQQWSTADASYREALARNIWAMDDTVPPLSARINPKNPSINIGAEDVPMLTKAYREGFSDFKIITREGDVVAPPPDLLGYLRELKNTGASKEVEKAMLAGKPLDEASAEHFANKWDVPTGFLTGEQYSTDPAQAIFGLAKAQKEYYNKFNANTVNPPAVSSVKPWLKPQNYQMVYDTSRVAGIDNFQVEALVGIKQRQLIQQGSNDAAVFSALKSEASKLPDFTDAELQRVNRGGAGAGFFSFANANYGSAGSKAEYVGSLVTNWIKQATDKVSNSFLTQNYSILNNPKETAVLAAVMQKVRAAGSNLYVMADDGKSLVLRSVRNYQRDLEAGVENLVAPIIPEGVDEIIPMTDAVASWAGQHIAVNGERVTALNNLRGSKGQPAALDPETFYPPAPNPARFKFHAFAVDDAKVTSAGHTTMLYADSAENLEKQIAAARAQGFNVFTPDQTAQYYKARGMYDYTKGLNESQMDAALKRTGSSAPAFPITGTPQELVQDIMEWHAKQEAVVIREAVSTKYSRQFGTLQQMGQEYASLSQAKAGWKGKFQGEAANPYEDYIKTFLGASLKADYPLWTALNNFVDVAGTKVYNTVKSIVGGSKSVYDLDEVNKVFDQYGMRMAATEAQIAAWVNHPAGQGAVSKFIRQQNSILASLTLRLDPVNALNNAIGSTVLTGAETASVVRGILAGNTEAVGELGKLAGVAVPGTTDVINSAPKLIASAYKNFFSPDAAKLIESYKAKGFISSQAEQFKELLEHGTIDGTETAAELESKAGKMFGLLKKLADTGEKWTGNKLAEEMNRFVSANIMDQITGVAVKRGLMEQSTADSYINTFVNRTQGNMIASQRPQVFQGPIGQAIGLFQTYQFNIMQQLLRHVGEGAKKDAITLLGLQGTVYGMNGLPAFQAINQHIIGTASGNTNHTDAYNSVNNVVGKNAGDWITYGVASNFLIDPDLKINLYSRGDINPRQVTVVPSNMADIPIVSGWANLMSSMKNSISGIANGGAIWGTLLSGVEHNGISRPLAGLARVARGFDGSPVFSTSGAGNIVSANDLYSLANLSRLSGAKPFDEAVTQDAVYRIQAYQAVDKQRRDMLGTAVKSVITSGGTPSQEQLADFAGKYAKAGGKQEEFSQWYVSQLRSATTPQANKIIQNGKTQYSQYMQSVMGGRTMVAPTYSAAEDPSTE